MPPRNYPPQPVGPPVVVSPRWIITAIGTVVGLALLCGYLTLCFLFYQGQWQLSLTPTRTIIQTPTTTFTELHFGPDASGQPQLDGWFLPAANDLASNTRTALLLHSGSGSLSNALPTVALLHDAGLNVLVFDYRGFGRSGGKHPTEHFMQEDAQAALTYLLTIRHVPAAQIVIVGEGIGASLATTLATDHPELRSLILINAEGDIDRRLATDSRAQLVPAHLLFHEEFPLAAPLATLATPKLLLTRTTGPAPETLRQAAAPKTTVELPPTAPRQETLDAITRFLSDR